MKLEEGLAAGRWYLGVALGLMGAGWIFLAPGTASAKGTPWSITLEGAADANGGSLFVGVELNKGTTATSGVLSIAPAAPCSQKAMQIATALDASPALKASVNPSNACQVVVQVQDDWATDDEIKEITFADVGTGEKIHRKKDDPADIFVDVAVDVDGTGLNRLDGGAAEAVLGIGAGPLAAVPTLGKTGGQIESELRDAFNALYAPTYTAALENDSLVVADVPCELGTVFGTDDEGLEYGHTMTRTTPFLTIPALPAWGLALVAAALLGLVARALAARRRAAPAALVVAGLLLGPGAGSAQVTWTENVPGGNTIDCPPPNTAKNAGNIDGDARGNDWLLATHEFKLVEGDGSVHRLIVYDWCLDHGPGGDYSFSVRKAWVEPGGGTTTSTSGPAGEVDGAPNEACPYPRGQNARSFYGPAGADGLPSNVKWYSKNPANKQVQITTVDTASLEYSQTRVGPGDAGYPPAAPPGVPQAAWDRYLNDPPVGDQCTSDSDEDGLADMEELMAATFADVMDTDADGVPDFDEVAALSDPLEPLSTPEDVAVPGSCADLLDNDLDGLADALDDGCGDADLDTVADSHDNCPLVANFGQTDSDGDGLGALCDSDDDDDGVPDVSDACLGTPLGWAVDTAGCEVDPDVDSICDPGTAGTFCSGSDNCPMVFNPLQVDTDGNGIGDACEFPVPSLPAPWAWIAVASLLGASLVVQIRRGRPSRPTDPSPTPGSAGPGSQPLP